MVEELLASPHRLSQFDLFRVLTEPELGPRLAQLPRCRQHPFLAIFVDEYGTELGNMESRMKLFVLLLKSRTSISRLEALHAWIRRIIHMRIHTHGLTLREASALWCCKRQRARLPREAKAATTSSKRQQAEPEEDAPKAKQRKTVSHFNGWHLFCRQAA